MNSRSDHRDSSEDEVVVTHGTPTDGVRWASIIAGTAAALTTLGVLGTLGVAIGTSSYDRGHDDLRNFAIAGGIWGIISTVVAFAVGGYLASASSAIRGQRHGLLNGALVAAVGIPILLFVVGSTATAMSAAELANGGNAINRVMTDGNAANSLTADNTSNQSFNTEEARRNSAKTAWSTLVGMLLAIGAASAAGYMGAKNDDDHLERHHSGATRVGQPAVQ